VIVSFDVLGVSHELEARVIATVIARWKVLTKNTSYLVHFSMNDVMYNSVDTGLWNFISRLIQDSLNFLDRCGHSGLLTKSGEPGLTAGYEPIVIGSP
jgi:hypothetical protein